MRDMTLFYYMVLYGIAQLRNKLEGWFQVRCDGGHMTRLLAPDSSLNSNGKVFVYLVSTKRVASNIGFQNEVT